RAGYAQLFQEAQSHSEEAQAELQRIRAETGGAVEAIRAELQRIRTAQGERFDRMDVRLAQVEHEVSRSRAEAGEAIGASRVEAEHASRIALEMRAELRRIHAEPAGAIEALRAESKGMRITQQEQLKRLDARLDQVPRASQIHAPAKAHLRTMLCLIAGTNRQVVQRLATIRPW